MPTSRRRSSNVFMGTEGGRFLEVAGGNHQDENSLTPSVEQDAQFCSMNAMRKGLFVKPAFLL
jgi:hypothetical protein